MKRFLFDGLAGRAALITASLCSASSALAAYPVSPGPTYPPDMLNYQYCETVIQVPTAPLGQTQPVFNTTGYDNCANYSALVPQDIVNSYNSTFYPGNPYGLPSGATSLIVNWPRNWVYDQAVEAIPPGTTQYLNLDVPEPNVPVTTFGFVGFNTGTSLGAPYVQSFVVRDATWTYYPNSLIYKLLDPSGNIYVMQSYARFENPSLTLSDLKNAAYMSSLIDMPPGWSYSVEVLTQQFDNVSTGNAVIVNDKLANSYMMVNTTLSNLPVGTPYSVPGPLPVLGAGMAFGVSRRLRIRIKEASH
jgi:haloalkane dehalogenase